MSDRNTVPYYPNYRKSEFKTPHHPEWPRAYRIQVDSELRLQDSEGVWYKNRIKTHREMPLESPKFTEDWIENARREVVKEFIRTSYIILQLSDTEKYVERLKNMDKPKYKPSPIRRDGIQISEEERLS